MYAYMERMCCVLTARPKTTTLCTNQVLDPQARAVGALWGRVHLCVPQHALHLLRLHPGACVPLQSPRCACISHLATHTRPSVLPSNHSTSTSQTPTDLPPRGGDPEEGLLRLGPPGGGPAAGGAEADALPPVLPRHLDLPHGCVVGALSVGWWAGGRAGGGEAEEKRCAGRHSMEKESNLTITSQLTPTPPSTPQ